MDNSKDEGEERGITENNREGVNNEWKIHLR